MDALTLLRDVSDAYRALKSLAIEAAITIESGDENSNQRNEQRVRFYYEAPDHTRYETGGRDGMIRVSDGKRVCTSFGGRQFPGRPRYASVPVEKGHRLPHLFRPEFPFAGGDEPFLFQGIEQGVADARILRTEDGCHVVLVSYEPASHIGVVVNGSHVLYWIDEKTRIVMRQQGEVGHRFPAEEEINWSRHTIAVRTVSVDEPLAAETFVLAPPPDVKPEEDGGCGISVGGGSGFIEYGTDENRRLEHRGSHEWDGDTLVEHSKWKMRGMTLQFERRLTFSADGKQLEIAERMTGPKGEVQGTYTLPVD